MATYNFDLLDLADGESGDAAVSVVAGKKKKADAAAKPAQPAAQERAAAEKYTNFNNLQIEYARQNHDNGVKKCQQEVARLKEVLIKLRAEETELKKKEGNEGRIKELSEEQRKLRQEQLKLRTEEATILLPRRKAFYEEHGIPLPEELKKQKSVADSGSNCGDANGDVCDNNGQTQPQVCDGGEQQYSHGYDERQHYHNGDMQSKPRMEYRPKAKVASVDSTEVERKPEQKVSSTDNANVVPASESGNSAGDAGQGDHRRAFEKVKLNGSEKRKKKNSKKNSGNEPEKSKKQDSEADKQPLAVAANEEEKKTLAEYERIRKDQNKSSEASKTEVRKVTARDFETMQKLEKKKLDDEETVIKVEKVQPKGKEATSKDEQVQDEVKEGAGKDAKPKKVIIPRQNLGFRPPRRISYDQEDGSFGRGRFIGGFPGSCRNNSTEPRVSGHGDIGRAAQNEAGGHNGNGAPKGSGYFGRGDSALRGDNSGPRNGYRDNGVYEGNGYQQQRQGRFQQEHAGNGGYYQHKGRLNQRRQYYQQRGSSADRNNSAPALEDMSKFPALPVPAAARSAKLASAPAAAMVQAPSAPVSAPANA